ncbi:MAG: hypothetical protein SGARI_001092 [Bacillariaceae sp.]
MNDSRKLGSVLNSGHNNNNYHLNTAAVTYLPDGSPPTFLVDEHDYIYARNLSRFDAAPIIVPEYKLAFFSVPKVACTTFKFLFRRINGAQHWDSQDYKLVLPHNPKYNGLKYLWDYSLEEANEIMTSPDWTRAIFVREPKQRFLSAFLDKAVGNDGWHIIKSCCREALECQGIPPNRKEVFEMIDMCHLDTWDSRNNKIVPQWNVEIPCCAETQRCREKASTMEGFLETIQTCHDEHWVPQSTRMEQKYWKYINFVGHMENMNEDMEKLLKRIGAWEKWGATGWGSDGTSSIVEANERSQSHTTNAAARIFQWYTPEREQLVEEFYTQDYNNPLFEFKAVQLTEPMEELPDGDFIKRSDNIYRDNDWDGAPVVIEKYKLLFFTIPQIGDEQWKQALRRMMGYDDWNVVGENGLPHDPATNGLKYLYHYPIEQAEKMMQSSEWTKALFVRSPKDRFLSVYDQMNRNRKQVDQRCCPHKSGCSSSLRNMIGFLELIENCYSAHWNPISDRMEEKYWPCTYHVIYVNYVGSIENAPADSQKLLEKIGAWDEIGKTGWGESGADRIFSQDDQAFDSVVASLSFYTPQVDKKIEEFYKADYESSYLNFSNRKVHAMDRIQRR